MPVCKDREYRAMSLLLPPQAAEKRLDSEYYVEGYATTFDDPYVLYEYDGVKYREQIDRHALEGADLSDVIMQYDHAGRVLARNTNGTLLLEPNERGLFIAADLSKSEAARSMYEEIGSGLVTRMSWAFRVEKDAYDRATRTRTILKIAKVYDVSAVSMPANPSTEISARSWLHGVMEAEKAERLAAQAAERKRQRLKLYLEVIR